MDVAYYLNTVYSGKFLWGWIGANSAAFHRFMDACMHVHENTSTWTCSFIPCV